MRLLITGGLGYLGGRLSQFFEQQGKFDILLGTRQSSEQISGTTNCRLVQISWDNPESLKSVCNGVDTIIHLAGMNANDCASDPVGALEFNALATAKLLHEASRQGVRRFIYFSTAHIYRSPLTGVISEETLPQGYHPYATSHRAAEDVVRSAHIAGEIEGIVMRLTNAFGAPVNKNANCWMLLVNDLCRQAVMTHKMILKTTGLQRRDFITMTDVCRATNYLLNIKLNEKGKIIFNIGGNWSPTVWDMACLIQRKCTEVLGFEPALTRVQPKEDDLTEDLDYRTDLLSQSGFKLTSGRDEEITSLLSFCKVSFC
jgi:UDP-glucose 4-epimerase